MTWWLVLTIVVAVVALTEAIVAIITAPELPWHD